MNNISPIGDYSIWQGTTPWRPHIGPYSDRIISIPPLQTFTLYVKKFAEYIWIDGAGFLRSKTKVLDFADEPPEWGFDGSSTEQADTANSDCILIPACVVPDPIRGTPHQLVLCTVLKSDGTPDEHNNRVDTISLEDDHEGEAFWFGLEQEYTMFKGATPLGVLGSIMPKQGPYYCGVGADEVMGRDIAEEHMRACLTAGLKLSGVNAEVMPGQWEFQVGPAGPTEAGDHVWLARYLLYRIAEKYGVTIKLSPKPVAELNGAGMHTNFSTKKMRESLLECKQAAVKLGFAVVSEPYDDLIEGKKYPADEYPAEYGAGYEARLTGEHETCKHSEFRYGVSDRGGSIRIPLPVEKAGKGYIEDRRPCANADPYAVINYIMGIVCEESI